MNNFAQILQCPADGTAGTRDENGICPDCAPCDACHGMGNSALNCYQGNGGAFEKGLMWVVNMWRLGKPVYEAYYPKLCEECTMDPWIVLRRLKQIMDCKIDCQPPYIFKGMKSGPPRPELAIGQNYDENLKLPYAKDNQEIKRQKLATKNRLKDEHYENSLSTPYVLYEKVINDLNDYTVSELADSIIDQSERLYKQAQKAEKLADALKTTITEIKPIHKDIASSLEVYKATAKAAREEIKEMRVSDTEPSHEIDQPNTIPKIPSSYGLKKPTTKRILNWMHIEARCHHQIKKWMILVRPSKSCKRPPPKSLPCLKSTGCPPMKDMTARKNERECLIHSRN